MKYPQYSDATFILDPAAGLTSDNLWKESGPFGLHLTPTGYAAPGYGLNANSKGTPYYSFDGATQYGIMSAAAQARFYANAPTAQYTWVAAFLTRTNDAYGDLFNCSNSIAANNYGIVLRSVATAAIQAIDLYNLIGNATAPQIRATVSTRYRRHVVVATVETAPTMQSNGSILAPAWAAGAYATPAYNTAGGVRVGWSGAPGIAFFPGDIYFVGLWPIRFSVSEGQSIARFLLRDRM